MPKTNTKKRAVPKRKKHEIKELVDAIPELIAKNMQEEYKPQVRVESRSGSPHPAHDPYKKRLVFIGVGGVMGVILLLWAVNIKAHIYDIKNSEPSVESGLLTEAKTNLGSVMADLEKSTQNKVGSTLPPESAPTPTPEDTLRTSLALILASVSASSTASTTPVTNTPPVVLSE